MNPRFRPLTAKTQLQIQRGWPALLPPLMADGLALPDAAALAYNAVFLYHVWQAKPPLKGPEELLERLSIDRIAALCEAYLDNRAAIEGRERRRKG